jgi:hypothetical protein
VRQAARCPSPLVTKTNVTVVWFGSQIISVTRSKPAETTTAFRGLFEQTVSLRSTTSDHLVALVGPHNTHPARRYPFRSLMLVKTILG